MTDCQFPIIHYETPDQFELNGKNHGEEFRREVKELFEIRKDPSLRKEPIIKR